MKFSLARQALVVAALSFLPGVGQAIYFRDKVSWRSPIPPSEMVSVDQARSWGGNVIRARACSWRAFVERRSVE
ncbi:MAG: hypothetical protein DME31_00735 [Verrucomicrobia bacterium]|nr:MAG: hypothetical protein DME31_00735 [Verrucomicrobiota bacterium]